MEVEFLVQLIAIVREASLKNYENNLKAYAEARKMWMLVIIVSL